MNEKDFKKWAGSENIKKAEEYRKNTYGLTDEGSKSYRELKAKANNMSLSKKETGAVSVSGNNPSVLERAGLIARGSARETFGGINTSGAIASTYLGRAMDRTMDSLGLGKDTEKNQKILNDLKASYEKANDKQKAMLEPTIKYYEAKVAGTEKQYAEQWRRNQIAEAQKMTEKGSQDIEKAKQGLGAVGQFAVDVGAGAAQLGMSALAGYGSALAPMMLSAAGNSAGEALNEGATLNQATAYGALSGAIEGATEKLFSFGKPFKSLVGKGLGDEAVENLARRATFNFVKSASGRELANGLVRTGLAATTEGAEEMISSLVNPWLKNLTYTDGEKVDVREVLYSGLVGSAVGGLLGGAGQISESRNYSKVGKAMQDLDATESVIQTGLDSNPDTDSYVFANRIRDIQSRGGEISNQDIGRLYKANRDTIKAEEEAKKKQGDRTYIVDGILQNAEKTSSGQAQSSTMGTGSTTRISDAVRSLGDNGAKALGQFYKGETDFDSYYAGFSRYYEAGVSNVPFEKINTEYAKNISEAVKYAAYSAGQNDAKISLKQEMKDSKFAKVYGKEGGLILDDVAKSLKPRLQETLNTVAKVSGTKIKIVESISTGDSEAGANGYYKSSEGIIYIAKDADNPLFVVAKHEITHHMQKVAPKEYRAYRDYVMSVISDGQAVDTLVEQKRAQYASAGQNLSVEEAMDEIVADYTEQIIKDENVLNEFISKGEKSVVQKFFDSVREFINRVKKAFKGDKTKMDAAAEETYGATISELERAEQLWLDALKATKKKAEQRVKQGVAEESSVLMDESGYTRYSLVTDKKLISFLENQEHIVTYKAMVQIDGKLYPPMASQERVEEQKTDKKGNTKTKTVRKLKNPSVLGRWQQADESPDIAAQKYNEKRGYSSFDLLKSNGKTVPAAYNPYEHTSNIVLNDQFEEAYNRPELVTVEYHIPKSELTSGYKADYAKNAVGMHEWKSGPVAKDLEESRKVYLTRWSKPVRVLPDSEVATKYKEILDGTGLSVPFNVVTPSLLSELEKVGVPINYEGSPQYKSIQKRKADKGNQDVKNKVSEGTDDDVGRFSIKNSVGKIEQFIEDRNDTELYDYENAKELYTKQKNLYSKYQEGTANKDNFMVNTMAEFQQIGRRPSRKPDYVSRDRDGKVSSEYWYTDDGVIRGSEHWGIGVASCDWALIHKNGKTTYGTRYGEVAQTAKVYAKARWDDFLYKTDTIKIDGKRYMTSFETSAGKMGTTEAHIINGKTYNYNKWEYRWEEVGESVAEKPVDSTGRKLTNQQAEYFKDSKVRDENPTADSDIRFSMKKPVEETKNLIAVHNVYMNKLEDALKLGGLPAPSIAITKSDIPHENFGEVSLVFRKESISPTDRRNKIYSGDAWTPTRVRVEYDVDDDVVEKFNNKIRELTPKWGNESLPSVDAGTANIEDESLSESYKRSVRARYAFLKEKGKAPRVVMRTPRQSTFVSNDTLIKIAKAFTGNQLKSIANTSEGYEQYKNAILKIIRDSENSIAEEYTNPKIKEIQLKKNAEKYSAENVSRSRIEDAARIAGYIKKDKYTIAKEIDKYATEDGIKKKFTSKLEAEFKAWVDENTKGAIRNKGIRNNKDLFTPSGNRRSFKELHDPYTLSNIVKNMFADAEKGIGAFGGSPIGAAQREYGSIEDVKADSDRLRLINDDEYKEIEREIYDDTTALANRMVINSDVFAVRDLLAEAIAKPTKKQADSYLRREAKGWAKYSPGIADELWDIKKRINNMPTGYFEAKPQRAVGFEEVVLAVIPKGKKELKKQLEDAGVQKVRYYDTKVEGDRLEKINKAPDVLFSLKGQSDLQKENAKLKEYNEYLKEQMKLTKDIKQDKKAMEKLSKGILKDYSSEMDSAELLRQLNEVYSYIANSDSPSWDELKPMARRVAGNILSQSVAINDELYQSYKELRNNLAKTRITLSEDYRDSLKDGYEDFRKANLGKFRLVNSGGRDVDVLYNELAETYPEFFDAEQYTHPVDQLEHIAEVLDSLKPVEENPYSYDMRNATEWLANEIIDRYFEVPQAKKTFADKQADKLTKEKIKGAEKLANQKERYENKIADIKLHSKQRIAEAVKREKAAKWDKVAQVKQAQREKESRLSDRRKHSLYVNKIRKHAAKISKMLLNPTETSHVPEPLRKPVAEFLSLFDMTSDRMEEKSIQKFQSLREAYLKIADSADATLMDIDPDLDANLEQIIEAFKGNGDLRISNMSAKDTETLYRAVMAVERSIYSYNKLMNDEKQATIADYGESAMEELATKHPFQEKRGVARVVGDTLNMDMVAPAEFFDELGGTMKSLYDDIRKGFDKKISNLEIARAYMEKLTKGIALKEITGNKARTTSFELSGGKIELTKAQVMSLYLLNKQPDAQEHIYTGGIKAAPIIARGEKGRRARIQKSFEVIKVTPEDVDEIIGSMSKEEKALADGIGKFFTDYTAEWGNEVSEKLYGYRKFTVENYFPIVSDKNYINQVFGETTDVTLKNMGSTKSRIKGANNPIIIEDVIDVFTRQVDSMASYNAFVIPLNDIQKVYNYKNSNGSVKQSIEKKFGVRANKCFSTFITDMNGGGKFDGGTGTFNFMLGKYKQAKMGLNLRVVLQQPTSYLRAAAVINPKYLTKAAASPKKIDYNLVMKYAPIARWKDWGHFSLDTSKSMKSIIMEKKEMSDYTMALAKQADRLTWGRLWKAAEYEIQDKHPELRKGSEEYYRAVGERFSEIIDKTQVVDSTLHRPQIMRRKDGLTRMTMSFMSEPMRSYNLLRTALRDAKVNPGKEATKLAFAAVTAYMTQVIVNHIITGFVDTLRGDDDDQFFIDKLMGLFDGDDDDDDETALTFEQRWIKHFVDNLINEPLSMFPAVKDVWSIVQGFSVERMDMASIGDLLSAVKRTFSDKYTPIFKMADVGSKVLDMFGVPASSFKREVATGAKLALGVSGNPVMEYKANKYLYNVKSNKKMYMDLLYKTMKSGDMESYYAIVEDMVNSGVPGSDIESAMRSRAKKDSEMGTDISNFDSTLAGIGIKYQDPEEKKEDDKFKVEDLDGAGYVEYSSIKQDILNQLISDFKTRGFGDLDEETANDILSAAYTYSESVALQKASDGAYEEDTKWILNAQEWADNLDVSLGQLIEYKAEYGDGVLDNKKTIKASELGVLDKYMDAYEFYNDIEPVYVTDSNGNYILDKNGNRKTEDEYKKKAFREYMNDADLTSEEYDDIWYLFYKRK